MMVRLEGNSLILG